MLSTGSSQRQYDANGNLTESTGRHDVNILYNYLNLPREIVTCTDTIHYIYDATGNKWAEYYSGTQTFEKYYMGNFQYTNQNLDYIHNAYGRIRLKNDEYHYDYYLSDHLGNVRAVFTDNGAGNAELLQANSYYPFGMQFKQVPEYQVESNNYLYNGKELQQYGNLNTYDYGWRQYDAALGRWNVQDKLAESFPGYSPYNYVKNSPINYIDPNGMYPDSWQRPGETVVAYNIRMNSPELYNMMYSDGVGGSGGGAGFAYAGGHYGWVKYTQYWYSYLPENEGKKITYTFGERDYYKFEWVEGPNVAQGGGDYFPGMPPPDGRIDLSASKTPYSDVINFMKALITDESKRGLIEKYFAPGNGQVNAGYAIISYPMNVQGHRVVVNLTFDPEHELTGVISPKRMKNPYGQMEYGLIARGASLFNDGNSTVSPWLINVHYPVGAGDLYRRTYEYLIGDRETWW